MLCLICKLIYDLINIFKRILMDPDKDSTTCKCNNLNDDIKIAYDDYHGFITKNFQDNFMSCYPFEQGLLIDIQSHNKSKDIFEMDYLVDLKKDTANYNESSIRYLASLSNSGFNELIRGHSSLGLLFLYKTKKLLNKLFIKFLF